MAAQPVGSETVLELFNAVFTLSAIVVELKDRMAAALQVGHQEAQVGAGGGVFGLIADAALTKPALGTVTETGKRALGLPGATIAASEPALETSGAALEDRVGGEADDVLEAEELAEFIEQRQREAGIGTQQDADSRKLLLQTQHQAQQQGHEAGRTGRRASPQPSGQQAAGVALEDQQRMVHVLVVGPVEEAQLLVVGGVDIEQDLAAPPDLLATDLHKPIQQSVVQEDDLPSGGSVFPTA